MRWTHLLSASFLALAVTACSAGAPVPLGSDADTPGEDAGRTATDGSPSGTDADQPGADAEPSGCTSPSDPGCDCDPGGQLAAYPILVDDLSTDGGQAEPATGFRAGAWSFTDGAYRQEGALEKDRDDASFLVLDEDPDDVLVEVTAASTLVTEHNPDLRQVLVTARANSKDSSYDAVACGIDLARNAAGEVQFKRVIAAELSGSPGSVTTNNRDTSDYDGVGLEEEFRIRMELQGDQMTCRVTVDGETTFATAGGFGGSVGSVGFHTRETQALFRDVTVCGL